MEKAIEQFKRTGKMPPTVAKFSIFRKEYFLGEFVPCLLRSVTQCLKRSLGSVLNLF